MIFEQIKLCKGPRAGYKLQYILFIMYVNSGSFHVSCNFYDNDNDLNQTESTSPGCFHTSFSLFW